MEVNGALSQDLQTRWNMLRLLLLVALLCGGESAGSHSLRYLYTGVTPGYGVPEFTAVGYVDEEQIDYYDSVTRVKVPRQQWMADSQGPDYWERETQKRRGWEPVFKANVQILQKRTNRTVGCVKPLHCGPCVAGIHTLQRMCGYELRLDGSSAGFYQFGWDGEDLISFDREHMVWVTPVTWGLLTKHKWDRDTGGNLQWKGYLEKTCIEWLRKYVQAGQRQLSPVQPEVSIFLSGDGSRVWCFTTGFYPRSIEVNLVRDGLVLDESRSHGTLPNHDGTFQQRRWAHVEPGDTAPLSCRVEHPGLSEPLEVFLGEWGRGGRGLRKCSSKRPRIAVIVGLAVVAVAVAVGGVLYWKKRQAGTSGYNPTLSWERGEHSSNSSDTA
ncbi:LOW QUALITY PROTEIN: class I histocompatibility antigen, F10 alpha chain-like [Leucoraja erinacea]|uniref:LOW QUALITY PROTEIN: class I histocompatibility antigen, F10 alpha chain-like n=1 Tax=Leucoraja erinaceus TaxID=7782 RepID=UPI002453A73C|nr:LOW QUALITY PROTEIN: class I histocompatibility antigen, F10 alpha chain-like [Leucoraja erinacea]